MTDHLEIYEKVRNVPINAKKQITGGRLSGFTDINPMWRIKALTETFGPSGFGWYTKIADKRMEAGANGEIACFLEIELYVKMNGEWSMPIAGFGGSSFVAKEKNGLYVSDECFKMAYTDALGNAAKSLGLAADVYWEKDSSNKYEHRPEPQQNNRQQQQQQNRPQGQQQGSSQQRNNNTNQPPQGQQEPPAQPESGNNSTRMISDAQKKKIAALKKQKGVTDEAYREFLDVYHVRSTADLTSQQASKFITFLDNL